MPSRVKSLIYIKMSLLLMLEFLSLNHMLLLRFSPHPLMKLFKSLLNMTDVNQTSLFMVFQNHLRQPIRHQKSPTTKTPCAHYSQNSPSFRQLILKLLDLVKPHLSLSLSPLKYIFSSQCVTADVLSAFGSVNFTSLGFPPGEWNLSATKFLLNVSYYIFAIKSLIVVLSMGKLISRFTT